MSKCKHSWGFYPNSRVCGYCGQKDEVVVENTTWCSHIVAQGHGGRWYLLDSYYDRPPYDGHVGRGWKNCPICGTPRPSELSKRERIAIRLFKAVYCFATSNWDSQPEDTRKYWLSLADAVIEEMGK